MWSGTPRVTSGSQEGKGGSPRLIANEEKVNTRIKLWAWVGIFIGLVVRS